jgi:hypothetical protein
VEKLRVRLTGDRPLVKRYTENLAAYNLCLKARSHLLKMTKEEREVGRRYCEQAIALDPNYALAHVMLAESYFWNAFWDHGSPVRHSPGPAALEASGSMTRLPTRTALGTVLGCAARLARVRARIQPCARWNPSAAVVDTTAWCWAMWFRPARPPRPDRDRRALERIRSSFYNTLLGYL